VSLPHLVLMPGMDGTGLLFAPLLRELGGASATVLAYPDAEPMTYEALVPRVTAALPPRGPFALIAESFSGPLALRVAVSGPPGLTAVVLCATFVTNPMPFPARVGSLARPALFRLFPAFVGAKALLGGYATPEMRVLFREVHPRLCPAVLALRAREILRVDVRAELASCPVPILYLRGRSDRVVGRRSAREVAAVNPASTLCEVEAGHLVLQTAPRECARVLEEFLGALPGARA